MCVCLYVRACVHVPVLACIGNPAVDLFANLHSQNSYDIIVFQGGEGLTTWIPVGIYEDVNQSTVIAETKQQGQYAYVTRQLSLGDNPNLLMQTVWFQNFSSLLGKGRTIFPCKLF